MPEHKPLEQRDVLIGQLTDYARCSDEIIRLLAEREELRNSLIHNGLLPWTGTCTSAKPPTERTTQ